MTIFQSRLQNPQCPFPPNRSQYSPCAWRPWAPRLYLTATQIERAVVPGTDDGAIFGDFAFFHRPSHVRALALHSVNLVFVVKEKNRAVACIHNPTGARGECVFGKDPNPVQIGIHAKGILVSAHRHCLQLVRNKH